MPPRGRLFGLCPVGWDLNQIDGSIERLLRQGVVDEVTYISRDGNHVKRLEVPGKDAFNEWDGERETSLWPGRWDCMADTPRRAGKAVRAKEPQLASDNFRRRQIHAATIIRPSSLGRRTAVPRPPSPGSDKKNHATERSMGFAAAR